MKKRWFHDLSMTEMNKGVGVNELGGGEQPMMVRGEHISAWRPRTKPEEERPWYAIWLVGGGEVLFSPAEIDGV